MPDAKISSDQIVTLESTDFIPAIRGTSNVRVAGSYFLTNPMTAAGDIIIGGTDGAPARLAKGTDGQFLGYVGGTVAPVDATTASGSTDLLVAEIIVGTGTNSGKTQYVGNGSAVNSVNFGSLDGNSSGGYTLHSTLELSASGEVHSLINGDDLLSNYSYFGSDPAVDWKGTGSLPRLTYAYAGAAAVSQIDRLPNGKIIIDTATGDNNSTPHNTRNTMVHQATSTNITALTIQPATVGTTIVVGSKFTLLRRK